MSINLNGRLNLARDVHVPPGLVGPPRPDRPVVRAQHLRSCFRLEGVALGHDGEAVRRVAGDDLLIASALDGSVGGGAVLVQVGTREL